MSEGQIDEILHLVREIAAGKTLLRDGKIVRPPSGGKLALLVAGAAVVATAIMAMFVLPAEFHRDPTGFGRWSGIDKIAGPEIVSLESLADGSGTPARYYDTPFRTDTVDIALEPEDQGRNELEYKVKMKPGATLAYSWTVSGDEDHPEWFYFDFHGESRPVAEGENPVVAEYLKRTGNASSGSLIAPFEGIHGWYLQNQSDKPVVVHLKLSGFYELVPAGEPGNEAGIEPLAPQSFDR